MNKKFIDKFLLLLVYSFLISQITIQGQQTRQKDSVKIDILTKLTAEDIQILLKDENPLALKQLSKNPEARKEALESLRQVLAMANQALKEGLINRLEIKEELENIRTEIVATSYDRKKNADKGPIPTFGFITEDEVKAFYADAGNEAKFKSFIGKKIEQAKEEGLIPKDREVTEEQLASARELYAKARIYEKEAEAKKSELGDDYDRKVQLQVKLQQTQYLARLYADKILKDKIRVSDADVQAYIAEHPEFNTDKQKTKAHKILLRAKAGENFAKLAKEFSEDPGSKENGGLYINAKKGQFVPEFENAALSLSAGQVAPNLIETKYGFHIIKLEKKGAETYDVRHILISTMVTDPNNPQMPPSPAEDRIRAKLEEEKEKKIIDELLASNPIQIPTDFIVPEPSAEQLEQMKKMQEMPIQQMQQMQQIQPPEVKTEKKPVVRRKKKKSRAKK